MVGGGLPPSGEEKNSPEMHANVPRILSPLFFLFSFRVEEEAIHYSSCAEGCTAM